MNWPILAFWLLLILFVAIAAKRLWGPRRIRCAVYELHDCLRLALVDLMTEGEGFVIVEVGPNFIQFCPNRDGGGLIVDIPTGQEVCPLEIYEAMEKNGFERKALYDPVDLGAAGAEMPTAVLTSYQKKVKTALEATLSSLEVLYSVFDAQDDDQAVLVTDFRKQVAPT